MTFTRTLNLVIDKEVVKVFNRTEKLIKRTRYWFSSSVVDIAHDNANLSNCNITGTNPSASAII